MHHYVCAVTLRHIGPVSVLLHDTQQQAEHHRREIERRSADAVSVQVTAMLVLTRSTALGDVTAADLDLGLPDLPALLSGRLAWWLPARSRERLDHAPPTYRPLITLDFAFEPL